MADRYWVGGSGTWNGTNTTNWSTSSGGVGGASVPTSSDNVFFDANSHTTNYTVTVATTNPSCLDFSMDAPASGKITFAGSRDISVYGSFYLLGGTAGITWTWNQALIFLSTSGTQIVQGNGVTFSSNSTIRFSGIDGYWKVVGSGSNGLVTAGSILLRAGTLDIDGNTITANSFQMQLDNSKTIAFGAGGVIDLNGSVTSFSVASTIPANFNYTGTGTIKFSSANTAAIPFSSNNGFSYPNLEISIPTTGHNFVIQGNVSIEKIISTLGNDQNLKFASSNTFIIGDLEVDGANLISNNPGGTFTLSCPSGLISVSNSTISDSIATGGATFLAYTTNGNTNGGNNTGWIFDAPVAEQAARDENRVTTILGTFCEDGITPYKITANPSEHSLSVSMELLSVAPGRNIASRDQNRVPVILAVSSADGTTPVELYTDEDGNLLIEST